MESSGAEKIDVGEVPQGFYSLYYLAMKYLVVLAPKDGKDTYMVSFLVSAGCGGIDSSAIGKKSRKDLDKERRYINLKSMCQNIGLFLLHLMQG